MKWFLILMAIVIVAGLVIFRKEITNLSTDALQADLNPQLVNDLQGDWAQQSTTGRLFHVNRDSLVVKQNDSVLETSGLRYVFNEAAVNYLKADSSFVFVSDAKEATNSHAFQLQSTNNQTKTVSTFTIASVSKNKMVLLTPNDTIRFIRIR